MLKTSYILTLLVLHLTVARAAEYYVAPEGRQNGSGSAADPWDLQSAIGRSSPARGGDTIWMKGGTYRGSFLSYLAGSPGNRVSLRGMTGERVTIDGSNPSAYPLTIDGAWADYRDFEVVHSAIWYPGAPSPVGIQHLAANTRMINLVIHDCGQGIGSWMSAVNAEIYGCIIYHNGGGSLEHGIYIQNDVRTGVKKVHDNIIFNNSGFGVHGYTQGGQLTGFDFQGNVVFNNGSKHDPGKRYDNIFVGGNPSADEINVVSNYTFMTPGFSRFNLRFSYNDHQHSPHGSINVRGNYIVGGLGFTADDWRDVAFEDNLVAVSAQQVHLRPPPGVGLSDYRWDFNRYHGSSFFGVGSSSYNFQEWRSLSQGDLNSTHAAGMPQGPAVFVRANRYDSRRAHITVYNWDLSDRVNAEVTGLLRPGDLFEVRNVQDYFGDPVLTGVYAGGPLTLPMTNLTVAVPGGKTSGPQPTGPLFNVFVLSGVEGVVQPPPPDNIAPTLTPIADQTLWEDDTTHLVAFTMADDQLLDALFFSVSSSNPALIPEENVVFGGNGATRSMRIRPAPDRSGTATLTVSVHDGWLSGSRTFEVLVRPVNDAPRLPGIPNQTMRSSTPSHTVPLVVVDDDSAERLFRFSATSSNPGLVSDSSILFNGGGQRRTLTIFPQREQTGTTVITVTVSDGEGVSSHSFLLTVEAGGPGDAGVYRSVAVSEGTLTWPMVMRAAGVGGGHGYVETPTFGEGGVAFEVEVPQAGAFRIWCRVLARHYQQDSVFVSMDDGPEDVYDVAEGRSSSEWQWTVVNGRAGGSPLTLDPRLFLLEAGRHVLRFRGREANTGLSHFLITNDPDYIPSDAVLTGSVEGGDGPMRASVIRSPGGGLLVSGFMEPGGSCAVEETVDLRTWVRVATVVADSTGSLRYQAPPGQGIRFFRFAEL